MAYSDFTLAGAIQTFNLTLTEQLQLFAPIPEQPASDFLQETLRRNVPLAIASNSEKARSELIIAPSWWRCGNNCMDPSACFQALILLWMPIADSTAVVHSTVARRRVPEKRRRTHCRAN